MNDQKFSDKIAKCLKIKNKYACEDYSKDGKNIITQRSFGCAAQINR